jgi:hypothetical protein
MSNEWSDLSKAARALVKHTIVCGLSVGSFMLLFWLAHKGLNQGWPLTILDRTENIVLVVVYVYFAGVVLYDLMQERLRAVIQFIRRLFGNHAVLA